MADPTQLADILADRFPSGVLVANPDVWPDPPDKSIEFQLGWWAALTMVASTSTTGLTDAEQNILSGIGALAADFVDLVGDGPTAIEDFREILPHLHALQQAIMAQAAARTHPGRYRLLGGSE